MFELAKEHEDFRRVVREFALAEVAPHVQEWDEQHRFPVELVPKMGDLGLFGLVVPEEFGGAGADFTSLCVAIEELGRVDQSVGITLSAGVGLGINPILTFGSQEQKERWLPDLVAGRALAAFGLTEAEAGSDAGATKTRARLDGDSWVVDGAKAFITNSGTPITSVVTVTAKTGERPDGRPEVSAVMIPAGTPGFTVEPAYESSAGTSPTRTACPSRTAGFRRTTCSESAAAASASSSPSWTTAGSRSAPSPSACPGLPGRVACEYAGTGTAFGPPIGANQAIAFPISDLAVAVEAARLLTYKAAWLQGRARAGRRGRAR